MADEQAAAQDQAAQQQFVTQRIYTKDISFESPMTPCLLYTSPSPRDVEESRMPSSA